MVALPDGIYSIPLACSIKAFSFGRKDAQNAQKGVVVLALFAPLCGCVQLILGSITALWFFYATSAVSCSALTLKSQRPLFAASDGLPYDQKKAGGESHLP